MADWVIGCLAAMHIVIPYAKICGDCGSFAVNKWSCFDRFGVESIKLLVTQGLLYVMTGFQGIQQTLMYRLKAAVAHHQYMVSRSSRFHSQGDH